MRPGAHVPPLLWALADVAGRAVVLGLLVAGLMETAAWLGRAVLAPGAWQALDQALFRAWNGLAGGPLAAVFVAALNEPGPNYFVLILLIIGYCWWRQPTRLPAAALAIGIALALGLTATGRLLDAGGGSRPRPFLVVAEARTPITACDGVRLVALRGAEGPTAACDGTPADLVGLDWRTTWLDFPTFPSGHLRETTALCLILGTFWPAARPFALAYLLVLGFSRVYLGAHYPSDVLVGALLGLWAGGATLFGLDLLRRLGEYLYRLTPAGAAWDWVMVSRVAQRPDLDPLPARLLRVAGALLGAHLALAGLGYAATNPGASQVYSVLQNADIWTYSHLAAPGGPAAAVGYVAVGPPGVLYILLVGATLAAARCAGGGQTVVALLSGTVLAYELAWLGGQAFPREPPDLAAAVWLAPAWLPGGASSFPSAQALLAGALAGLLAGALRRGAPAAQCVGLAAALVPVSLGACWVVDALAGYLLGSLAAACGRYTARQFVAPRPLGPARPAPMGLRHGRRWRLERGP